MRTPRRSRWSLSTSVSPVRVTLDISLAINWSKIGLDLGEPTLTFNGLSFLSSETKTDRLCGSTVQTSCMPVCWWMATKLTSQVKIFVYNIDHSKFFHGLNRDNKILKIKRTNGHLIQIIGNLSKLRTLSSGMAFGINSGVSIGKLRSDNNWVNTEGALNRLWGPKGGN